MILDFVQTLVGDFIILTLAGVGLIALIVVAYLLVMMEIERRKEKDRIAKGEISDLEKTILRTWSRL